MTHLTNRLSLGLALGVTGVVCAADQGAPAPAAAAIRDLLELGAGNGKPPLNELRQRYERSIAVAPRDARLEYAYSLLLNRAFQPAEASRHFQRSLEIDPRFAPAVRAAIREQLKARQFADAGTLLAAHAQSLDPTAAGASEAKWLGRIVGCLSTVVGTSDSQIQFGYLDRQLRRSLAPVLLVAYENGHQEFHQELEEYQEGIDAARNAAETKTTALKAEQDADLRAAEEEIKLKRQDSARTREKWDEWIQQQLTRVDTLLRDQEREFLTLENSSTAQINRITSLQLALDRIDRGIVPAATAGWSPPAAPLGAWSGTNATAVSWGTAVPNRTAIENQLAIEELRLTAILDRQAAVARNASNTLAARRQAVASYQQRPERPCGKKNHSACGKSEMRPWLSGPRRPPRKSLPKLPYWNPGSNCCRPGTPATSNRNDNACSPNWGRRSSKLRANLVECLRRCGRAGRSPGTRCLASQSGAPFFLQVGDDGNPRDSGRWRSAAEEEVGVAPVGMVAEIEISTIFDSQRDPR